MSDRNNLRSQALDLLRFPLAVVIVVIHVFSFVEGSTDITEQSGHRLFVGFCYFIHGFLKSQSVPIYFFISGYVFFLGIELTKDTYIRKLKNRVKSLLIPYLIWNTLAVVRLAIICVPFLQEAVGGVKNFNFSWSGLLSSYWIYDGSLVVEANNAVYDNLLDFPIDAPLWFVRDLMVVVLFTPLIWWVLRRTKYYAVVLLGCLWFVTGYFRVGYLNNVAMSFFFFSYGAYMSINRKDMLIEFGKYFRSSVFMYLMLGVINIVSEYYFPDRVTLTIKQLNIFVGLVFAYNLSAWLIKKGICKVSPFLSSASFFVYVSHAFVVGGIILILTKIIRPLSDFSCICVYLLSTVLIIGLLLSVFRLLRRYCPRLLNVIAGRRGSASQIKN